MSPMKSGGEWFRTNISVNGKEVCEICGFDVFHRHKTGQEQYAFAPQKEVADIVYNVYMKHNVCQGAFDCAMVKYCMEKAVSPIASVFQDFFWHGVKEYSKGLFTGDQK